MLLYTIILAYRLIASYSCHKLFQRFISNFSDRKIMPQSFRFL